MRRIKIVIKELLTIIREVLCYYSIDDKTVLLITHDLSLSGAPIVLMNLAEVLNNTGYKPVIISPLNGKLGNELTSKGFKYYVLYNMCDSRIYKKILNKSKRVIVNTIVNYRTIQILEKLNGNQQIYWWIHEGGTYINQYKDRIKDLKLIKTKVLVVSRYVERQLHDFGILLDNEKDILPYFIIKDNLITNLEKRPNHKYNIAIIGSICKRKNQIELIKAVDSIYRRGMTDIYVYIVGSSIDKEYYTEMINVLSNVNCDYQLIDAIPKSSMKDFYQKLDLLVCTSIDDPLPVVISEAMNYKIPVLCSNCTGHFDLIKDGVNGFTYTLHDSDELITKLFEIKQMSKSTINVICNNEKELVNKEFSKHSFTKKVLTLLENKDDN